MLSPVTRVSPGGCGPGRFENIKKVGQKCARGGGGYKRERRGWLCCCCGRGSITSAPLTRKTFRLNLVLESLSCLLAAATGGGGGKKIEQRRKKCVWYSTEAGRKKEFASATTQRRVARRIWGVINVNSARLSVNDLAFYRLSLVYMGNFPFF